MVTQTATQLSVKQDERETAVSLPHILSHYAPISLNEMNDVALLNRTDTKFVMTESQLKQALSRLQNRYRVLEIKQQRLNQYQTLYFDTEAFDLYQKHHAGWTNRYKVRSREYVDSHISFFEVKHKTNKNRTVKSRMQTDDLATGFDAETAVFLHNHAPLNANTLHPTLWNSFTRITLVSNVRPERLTLDTNLAFHHDQDNVTLPGIAIAEVKQEGFSMRSDFIQQMRGLGIRPSGFSKYCIGATLLYPTLKSNNFKPKLRHVNKLMQQEAKHGYLH
ncbi:MAG: VTC domain-containing protein [Chloroflexi bacterium]|nr:MAG: VTC domain-containing protein [Chloroflexota bacterium]